MKESIPISSIYFHLKKMLYLLHDYEFHTVVLFNTIHCLLFSYLLIQYIHWLCYNLLSLHLNVSYFQKPIFYVQC